MRSAASQYCEQLLQIMMKCYWNSVMTFIKNISAHGLRKGSATHVSSGKTMPPLIASIAARGDWSLGKKVLDIHWQFAQTGDAYLGQSLTGLDSSNTSPQKLTRRVSTSTTRVYIATLLTLQFVLVSVLVSSYVLSKIASKIRSKSSYVEMQK